MSAVLRLCLSLLLGLLLAGRVWAIDPLPFADANQETRFRALVAELRCLQCQNQNLADSDAQIARDLRREIFDQIAAGRSDDEIVAFLVEWYASHLSTAISAAVVGGIAYLVLSKMAGSKATA